MKHLFAKQKVVNGHDVKGYVDCKATCSLGCRVGCITVCSFECSDGCSGSCEGRCNSVASAHGCGSSRW